MRVGVAPHAGQEADVVDDGALGFVEPKPVAQAECHHTGAQHVFHRLAVAEIGRQREGRHDLSEAYLGAFATGAHVVPSLSALTARAP